MSTSFWKPLVSLAYQAQQASPTSTLKEACRKVVADETSPAIALIIAMRHLLGPEAFQFEPETLWAELHPGVANRDKLSAAIALSVYPSFYWDYRVFGHTCLAFGQLAVHPESVPTPDPMELAWGVGEAELILCLSEVKPIEPRFSDSVATFAALTLFNAGFVYAPDHLSFCDEFLKDRVTDQELRTQVIKSWKAGSAPTLGRTYADTAEGVQLEKLASLELYAVNRVKHAREALERLA